MVKENNVTLSLSKGMQQTEIGLIPEDWEVVELSKVLIFGSGKDYKHLNQGDVPVFGTGGLMTFVSEFLYEGDSVGIGRKGTIDKPVFLRGKFWTVDTLFYTHSFQNTTPLYIYYQFGRIPWKEYNEASGVPSLNKNTLEQIAIPLPPLPEQQAIAEALSDADAWISSLEDLIAKKRLIKQGAMQELLTPKEGWEVKKLGEIGKFYSTNSLSRDKMNYVVGETYNIHYGDIHTKFRSFFNIERENVPFVNSGINTSGFTFFCKQGDLVIADASEDELDIGKAIEIGELNGKNVVCGLHTIHFRPTENIFAIGYIGFLWQSHFIKSQIIKEAQGTKVLGISTGRLRDLVIKSPSMMDQTRIATILSDMDTEIEQLEQKLGKARQIKQGMMQELLTGRVRLI